MPDVSIKAAGSKTQDFDRATSTLAVRSLRALAQSPQSTPNNKEKAKIEKSAHDFESILIGQWLEQAEKSFATVPGDDPDKANQDVGQDQMRSIAFHSLADGLTKAGGFGIAGMIIKHLEAAEARQTKPGQSSGAADKSGSIK